MTAVRAVQIDEQGFAGALDRWSPGLLVLARSYAADAATAHRMVEHGWLGALRSGGLDDPASSVRVTVVRAMSSSTAVERDPSLAAAQRELRLAVRASGVLVLPAQREGRRPVRAPGLPPSLDLADLGRLPPPLRLVLLLTDVQGWTAAEVEELLEVRPAARRAILGHARRSLLATLPPRSATA